MSDEIECSFTLPVYYALWFALEETLQYVGNDKQVIQIHAATEDLAYTYFENLKLTNLAFNNQELVVIYG